MIIINKTSINNIIQSGLSNCLSAFIILMSYQYLTITLGLPIFVYIVAVGLGLYFKYTIKVNDTRIMLAVYAVVLIFSILMSCLQNQLIAIIGVISLISVSSFKQDSSVHKYNLLANCVGNIFGVIIAIVSVHFISNIVKHSGNRVVYYVNKESVFIATSLLAIIFIYKLIISIIEHKNDIKQHLQKDDKIAIK